MPMTLSEKLQKLMEQAEAGIPPPPWYVQDGDLRSDYGFVIENLFRANLSRDNARRIADSVNAVPALARALDLAIRCLDFHEGTCVTAEGQRTSATHTLAEITKLLLPEEKV